MLADQIPLVEGKKIIEGLWFEKVSISSHTQSAMTAEMSLLVGSFPMAALDRIEYILHPCSVRGNIFRFSF